MKHHAQDDKVLGNDGSVDRSVIKTIEIKCFPQANETLKVDVIKNWEIHTSSALIVMYQVHWIIFGTLMVISYSCSMFNYMNSKYALILVTSLIPTRIEFRTLTTIKIPS